MSTALARADDLTEAKVALLRRTLCPELNTDEMELFAGVCRRTGLDPFAKQIYGIKRKGKLTIQTGIDGFRVIASRTGDLDGQEGPFWCGEDGIWRDVWVSKGFPAAAKVIVYRRGCTRGFVGVARFGEYAQAFNGKLGEMWDRMPATMIAKCAEALALRKAFPSDLSGLYTSDEMDQAGDIDPPAIAEKPKAKPAAEQQKPAPQPAADAPKQLPPLPQLKPSPAAEAERIHGANPPGDPMADVSGILALLYSKGWDWAGCIHSINDKFGAKHGVTSTKWVDIPEVQRRATVDVLNKLPNENTVAHLEWLVVRVAKLTGEDGATAFAKYCAAADLPERCVKPDDLTAPQVVKACRSFAAKLDALRQAESE